MPPSKNKSNQPDQQSIAERAYQIYVDQGRPSGCELTHWMMAEKELSTPKKAKKNLKRSSGKSGKSK